MAVKTIPGYFSKLTHILEPTDRSLPVDNPQTLINRLSENGDWTTLIIQDTVGYEVVKVMNYQGNLVLDRGLSGTTPKRFPVGSCISFSPSDELFKTLACEADCCENGVDETFGESAEQPSGVTLEQLPKIVLGGASSLLGEPTGFMLINGKKVPYYE